MGKETGKMDICFSSHVEQSHHKAGSIYIKFVCCSKMCVETGAVTSVAIFSRFDAALGWNYEGWAGDFSSLMQPSVAFTSFCEVGSCVDIGLNEDAITGENLCTVIMWHLGVLTSGHERCFNPKVPTFELACQFSLH